MATALYISKTPDIIRFTHQEKAVCIAPEGAAVELDDSDEFVQSLIRTGKIQKSATIEKKSNPSPSNT